MGGLSLIGRLLGILGQRGGTIIRCNWGALLAIAALLTSLWILLSRRDQIFQISFDNPIFQFQDVLIIGTFDFAKLLLIGLMVKNTLQVLVGEETDDAHSSRYWFKWISISFVFAISMIGVNAAVLQLEFGGDIPLEPVATIAVKLGAVYIQMILLWVAVCWYVPSAHLLIEQFSIASMAENRFDLIVAATIITLVPAGLVTTLILYSPIVAPFWFGLDQLGGAWTILVQMVSVIAETVTALLYAVFIAVSLLRSENKDAGSLEPAS